MRNLEDDLSDIYRREAEPAEDAGLITQVSDKRIQQVIDHLDQWKQKGCPGIHISNETLCTVSGYATNSRFQIAFFAVTHQNPQDYVRAFAGSVDQRIVNALNKLLTPSIMSSYPKPAYFASRIGIGISHLQKACKAIYNMSLPEYLKIRYARKTVAPVINADGPS